MPSTRNSGSIQRPYLKLILRPPAFEQDKVAFSDTKDQARRVASLDVELTPCAILSLSEAALFVTEFNARVYPIPIVLKSRDLCCTQDRKAPHSGAETYGRLRFLNEEFPGAETGCDAGIFFEARSALWLKAARFITGHLVRVLDIRLTDYHLRKIDRHFPLRAKRHCRRDEPFSHFEADHCNASRAFRARAAKRAK